MTAAFTPRKRSRPRLLALLAVLLGIVACSLPLSLPTAETGYRGWIVTTVGISAVSCAIAAARARAAHHQSVGTLTILGGTLGVAGTILCLWTVVAFYSPGTVPPVPQLSALTGQNPAGIAQPSTELQAVAPATGTRIVAPIEGANITAPEQQLHANVRHIASHLCIGISSSEPMRQQYGDQFGGLPLSLTVEQDGTVTGGNATYSKLPADMTLEYSATQEGTYSLTVRDVASGLGVGCDSTSNELIDR